MLNELIPLNEFQTAEPSSEGLLTVRSTNTESPSNNDLIDTYGLNPIEMIPPDVVHENLPPDSPLITPYNTVEEIPVIFYDQGTCFTNLDSSVLITDKEELFLYLCDVLIRFDTAPAYYQKGDYEALIRMLTGSLIYLYDQDSKYNKSLSASPFLGIATPFTNPIAYATVNNYKFPGVYFAQISGVYTNFGITVTTEDLVGSIVMLIPNIIDEVFVDYRKEIYSISGTSVPKNETLIGDINGINKVFTTSAPFVNGSLVIFLNGIREHFYTINSTSQITFDTAPSNAGMLDIVEATYLFA
ncbi:MAG: hypothetical protein ACOYMD_03155 [Paludibacter sp.]